MDGQQQPSKIYFALLDPPEFVQEAKRLEDRYRVACEAKGLRQTWRLTYAQKYGQDPQNLHAGAGVQATGDVDGIDELRLRSNLGKTLIRQAIILAMGDRVGYQAVATNLDVKSESQVNLVGKMLDYVTTEAKIDERVFLAADTSETYGSGGIHVMWDRNLGDPVTSMEPATDPDTGQPLPPIVDPQTGTSKPYLTPVKKPSGGIKMVRTYPWQTIKDVLLEDENWIIIKEPVSRFELAAMFPERAEEILSAPGPNAEDDFELMGFSQTLMTQDVVVLRHFYHKNCKAIPGGRYIGYLPGLPLWNRRCPIQNGGLPYSEIASMKYDGTSLGHPEAADVASMVESFDDMLSAAITNIARFKRQTLYVDERIKYDGQKDVYTVPEGVSKPETANFQQLPESAKFFFSWFPEMMMQTLGLNNTAMGSPEGANMSGVAIASLTQTAIKLQKPLAISIDTTINEIGNISLELYKANATNGFIAEIAGHTDAPLVKTFTTQDLEGVRRVKMIRTSPIFNTIAGKQQIYDSIKDEPIDRQRKIVEMYTTNSFEPLFEDDYSQTDMIRWENEELTAGRPVTVGIYDDPKIHSACHRTQMDKIRMMPDSPEKINAIKVFGEHIADHGNKWLAMPPVMAEAFGIGEPKCKAALQAAALGAVNSATPPTGADPQGPAPSSTPSATNEPVPANPAQPHPNYPRG